MRRTFSFAALLLSGVVFAGCPIYPDASCYDSSDCGSNQVCDAQSATCVTVNGRTAGGIGGNGDNGSSCAAPGDCGQNETCSPDALCVPGDCSIWGCVSGYRCQTSSGSVATCEPDGSNATGGKGGSGGSSGVAGAAGAWPAGGASTAGAAGASAAGAAGASTAGAAGASTAGAAGASTAGSGGAQTTGGSGGASTAGAAGAGTAGMSATAGGAGGGTGGTSSTGGTGTAGSDNAGGSSTAGTSSTGGTGTAGSDNAGGAAGTSAAGTGNGGSSAAGTSSTGGSGTAGSGTAGAGNGGSGAAGSSSGATCDAGGLPAGSGTLQLVDDGQWEVCAGGISSDPSTEKLALAGGKGAPGESWTFSVIGNTSSSSSITCNDGTIVCSFHSEATSGSSTTKYDSTAKPFTVQVTTWTSSAFIGTAQGVEAERTVSVPGQTTLDLREGVTLVFVTTAQ